MNKRKPVPGYRLLTSPSTKLKLLKTIITKHPVLPPPSCCFMHLPIAERYFAGKDSTKVHNWQFS